MKTYFHVRYLPLAGTLFENSVFAVDDKECAPKVQPDGTKDYTDAIMRITCYLETTEGRGVWAVKVIPHNEIKVMTYDLKALEDNYKMAITDSKTIPGLNYKDFDLKMKPDGTIPDQACRIKREILFATAISGLKVDRYMARITGYSEHCQYFCLPIARVSPLIADDKIKIHWIVSVQSLSID